MTLPTWSLIVLFFILSGGGLVSAALARAENAQPYFGRELPGWLFGTWLSSSIICMLLGLACLAWALWRLVAGGGA